MGDTPKEIDSCSIIPIYNNIFNSDFPVFVFFPLLWSWFTTHPHTRKYCMGRGGKEEKIHVYHVCHTVHIYILWAKLESGQIRNLPVQNWNSNSARSKSEF
jgi:hypothetical protein